MPRKSTRSRIALASIYTEIPSADADAQAILSAFSTKGTVYLTEIGDLSLALQELIINTYFHSDQAQTSRLLCGTSRELIGEVKILAHERRFLLSGLGRYAPDFTPALQEVGDPLHRR